MGGVIVSLIPSISRDRGAKRTVQYNSSLSERQNKEHNHSKKAMHGRISCRETRKNLLDDLGDDRTRGNEGKHLVTGERFM